MQREYLNPSIGDRMGPKEWVEQGRPSVLSPARARVKDILAHPHPEHVRAGVDAEIRRRFPVRLGRRR